MTPPTTKFNRQRAHDIVSTRQEYPQRKRVDISSFGLGGVNRFDQRRASAGVVFGRRADDARQYVSTRHQDGTIGEESIENGECPDCGSRFGSLRGVKLHHTKSHPDTALPGLDETTLRALYVDQRLSLREMADLVGYSDRMIHDRLVKYGIKRRGRSEAVHLAHKGLIAPFRNTSNGYEAWRDNHPDGYEQVSVHRLLAVAKYGFDAVCDMDVHHENGIKWDNREDNISLLSSEDHGRLHRAEQREHGVFGE